MDFLSFLHNASTKTFWAQSTNICFRSEEFSPVFFNALWAHLEKNNLLPFPKTRLDLSTTDKKTLLATLNQSILGNCAIFWLSNISADGIDKGKAELIPYFLNYQGPHHLMYFLSKDAKAAPTKDVLVIDIPGNIDLSTLESLFTFFKQDLPLKKIDLLKRMFKENKTLPLDTACLIINYLELINVKNVDEFSGYLAHITQTQPSLNLLSEYFFTVNPPKFFSLWSEVEKEYPEMFWIAFWSEQLWKANHVIGYLNKNDFVNAKRMSFRLPYSFITTHWKKFSQKNLTYLYRRLYLIDTKIKRGNSSETALNFFFFSYFFEKTQTGNRKVFI